MSTDLQPIQSAPPVAPMLAPVGDAGGGPSVGDYLGVFKKRPKLIIMPAFVGLLIAAIVVYVVPPRYEAVLKFKVQDPSLLQGVVGSTQTIVPHKPLLATIQADILNKSFLEPIIRKVGLEEGFDFRDPQEISKFYAYVFKNLVIELIDARVGADVISITYTGRDPRINVEFLTGIRQAYDEYFRAEYRSVVRQIYTSAENLKRETGTRVQELQAEYDSFRESPEFGLVSQGSDLKRQLETLSEAEVSLQQQIKSLLAQERVLEAQIRVQVPQSVQFGKIPNPSKGAVSTKLEAEKAVLNDLVVKRHLTDKVKAVMTQREKIAELETQLAAMPDFIDAPVGTVQVNKTYQTLLDDRMKLRRILGGEQDALENVRKRLALISEQLETIPNLSARRDEYDNKISLEYENLADAQRRFNRVQDAWFAVRGKGSDLFRDLQFPEPNSPPVFPSLPIFLGIGFGAGLLIGLGLAFTREFAGMTFSSANQVQGAVPLPILGEVGRITTTEEIAEERAGRRKNIVAVVVFLSLVGGLHALYFLEQFDFLPVPVIEVMDAMYGGGR